MSSKYLEHEDNQGILNLVEEKLGLIHLLNEECFRPNVSDACFVNKLLNTHNISYFKGQNKVGKTKLMFTKRHLVGYRVQNCSPRRSDGLQCNEICDQESRHLGQ